jgi:hypothetical protein
MQSVEIKLFGFFILKKSICLVAVPNQTHLSKPMFRPVGGMVSDGKGHTPHRSNSIALASGKGKRCWAVAPVVVTLVSQSYRGKPAGSTVSESVQGWGESVQVRRPLIQFPFSEYIEIS